VDAFCRRFGWWQRLHAEPSLDPRQRTGADSGASAVRFRNRIERGAFTRWSISDHQWTHKLDRLAAGRPERQWRPLPPTDQVPEPSAWVKPQPGESQQAQKFAAVRWKPDGALMWRYADRVCQAEDTDRPQAVFERPRLKGAKEPGARAVLSGLALHHPPCKDRIANQAFYALAMIACKVVLSLKMLDLPEAAQSWRLRTILRALLTGPVRVRTHARSEVARIGSPAGWRRWWRRWVEEWVPKRKPGRPVMEVVDATWQSIGDPQTPEARDAGVGGNSRQTRLTDGANC